MSYVIGMVGLPAVGKSYLAEQISKRLGITHINRDKMRMFFREQLYFYKDADHSYSNPSINSLNLIIQSTTEDLAKEILSHGEPVIIDSYSKSKKKREYYRKMFDKVIIIYVTEDDGVIKKRLAEREMGEKWLESYEKRWKPAFDIPTESECELLITARSDEVERVTDLIKRARGDSNPRPVA